MYSTDDDDGLVIQSDRRANHNLSQTQIPQRKLLLIFLGMEQTLLHTTSPTHYGIPKPTQKDYSDNQTLMVFPFSSKIESKWENKRKLFTSVADP
jgi:hypothetical protein